MILNLSEETRILDAASGMPLSIKELEEGETIYAYIGETMTASLPPQTTARLVLAHIQEKFKGAGLYRSEVHGKRGRRLPADLHRRSCF